MSLPPPVPRRRFGRTELSLPVFSTGGMRYQQSWQDLSPEEIEQASTENIRACVNASLACGIDHIETARGYGSSERQLGEVLADLPRESFILQTKIGVGENLAEFEASFETSLSRLRMDEVDLLSIHGINTSAELDRALDYALPRMRRWRREGRIRFIGFSTHGAAELITRAVTTGEFDYLNLHWYFVNRENECAIRAARHQDMGVFIISPNDKGGRLWNPPPKLREFCSPLTPMQFNDLFCLSNSEVHTLSLGVSRPEDYAEHLAGLRWFAEREALSSTIADRILREVDAQFVPGWHRTYAAGVPTMDRTPGGLHVREILRLYTWAKAMDMLEYARARYNMFGNGGAWFPGAAPADFDETAMAEALVDSPHRDRILIYLREAHELLKGDEVRRQSQEDEDA